ncbi:MAG: F390 synthetase-related protein [bacterium]
MNALEKAWYVYQLRRRFCCWSKERLHNHQQQRLAVILEWARRNSPYYSNLLPAKRPVFTDVPVMDKETMMEHFDSINTAGLHRDSLVDYRIRQEKEALTGLFAGKYSVGLSSGTSGNKVVTVLSPREREEYGCLLYARNGIPAHIRRKRILFALRTNNPAFMEVTRFGVTMVHVDYTQPPEQIIRIIREKKLNILAGPPSLLAMVATMKEQIGHPVEALISYAEVLEPHIKQQLETAFSAPVVQIYQGAEGFIGSTCRHGNMHLNEDLIFTEEVDASDPAGRIKSLLITDLYRKTQPILRYRLNDLVELSDEQCPCGSSFRIIKRVHGRMDDVLHIYGSDGTLRNLFPDYVCRSINQASDDILEYQALQDAPGKLEIRLLLKDNADRYSIENKIRDNLQEWVAKAGGIPAEIFFPDRLPQKNPRSHKMIRVVRNSR